MDSTPIDDRISEMEELDPAEAVDAAEELAHELESGLAEEPPGEDPEPPPA